MTDNEIIKALKCCPKCTNAYICTESKCPLFGQNCLYILSENALNLINRQKAEIDNLHSDTIPKLQAALVRANKYGLQADEANRILKEEIKRLQGLANYHRNLINELNKGIAEAEARANAES